MQVRPFGGETDIAHMRAVLRAGAKHAPDAYYWHIGDLNYWLWYHLLQFPPQQVIFLWEDGADIIGWVILAPHFRGIKVFVLPELRGTSIESDMIAWAAERIESPIVQLLDVAHTDTPRIQTMETLGFERIPGRDGLLLKHSLANLAEPHIYPPYTLTTPDNLTKQRAWAKTLSAAFDFSGTPALRLLNIFNATDYNPAFDWMVQSSDGQGAALAQGWFDPVLNTGLIEPVGTHPRYRRQGFGRQVNLQTLHSLKNAGCQVVWLHTRKSNSAAVGLYQSIGFTTHCELLSYQRTRPAVRP